LSRYVVANLVRRDPARRNSTQRLSARAVLGGLLGVEVVATVMTQYEDASRVAQLRCGLSRSISTGSSDARWLRLL